MKHVRRWLLLIGMAISLVVPTGSAVAHGADDICVGLVVDFGALGGGPDTDCVTVARGSTGADVLQHGGHQLTVCRDGIIGEIDGRPENGCATKDSTHYWSYWHRTPGSDRWTYSTEGPATYEPANTSTEGWAWQNGSDDNVPPPDIAYDDICKPTPSPSPTASSKSANTPAERTRERRSAASSRAATATSPTPSATETPATATATRAPKRPGSPFPSATPTADTAVARHAAVDVASDETSDGDGPPVSLLVVVVLAAVLGGAAAWRWRRGRGES